MEEQRGKKTRKKRSGRKIIKQEQKTKNKTKGQEMKEND
jgi:hypothetical protein